MGLFSSSYKTSVGTTVSRVIADDALPQSVKSGVISSIFENGQMDEYIMESLASGVGIRAGRMYEYGKNQYSYGLPSSTMVSSTDGTGLVTDVLQGILGPETTLDYCHYGPLNNLHFGWMDLVKNHGYNLTTNLLGALSVSLGASVYLKDLVVVVTEASMTERTNGSLDQWGSPANAGKTPVQGSGTLQSTTFNTPTPFVVDAAAAGDYLRASYIWRNAAGALQEGSFTIPVTGLAVEGAYFHAKYTYANGSGYWLYQEGAGTYPELDALYSPVHDYLGSFFPFAYFRFDKTPMDAKPDSAEYKTSKKLVKYLGMDYGSVIDAIHENPDIGQVEQAMMMMAVPANTIDPLEQRYLFDFFRRMYFSAGPLDVGAGGQSGASNSWLSQKIQTMLSNNVSKISMVIQDARFKMALGCHGIFKYKKVGVIGPVGSYASGLGSESVTNYGTVAETGERYTWESQVPAHYYRHQVSATVYEEIQVYDLRMTYFIYGNHTTVGDGAEAILMIPVDSAITDTYSIPDKETLYARSLHYIFNSRVVTEVKWYQSGLFQAIITIIGIVISVWNLPAGMAILAGNSVFVTAVLMAFYASLYLVTNLAIKLFIKLVGAKLAFLIAVVAAIRGVYVSIEAGSIAGAPWAKELLQVASNLSSAVGNSYAAAIKGLQSEAESFLKYTEEKTKELEDSNKLLDSSSVLSPFVIFGETPDQFFNRTVHSGNIGITGIEAISSYVEMSLTLPKLTDTLPGANYGI